MTPATTKPSHGASTTELPGRKNNIVNGHHDKGSAAAAVQAKETAAQAQRYQLQASLSNLLTPRATQPNAPQQVSQ
jgi:hypothetical protein